MKKILVLTAMIYALGWFGGSAWADEIKVLQPMGGTYNAGTSLVIKWDYMFMEGMPQTAAEKKMRIELLHFTETGGTGHGGGKVWTVDRTIAEVDVLTNQYPWPIPYLIGGPNQVIRITMVNRPALTALSDPFTIIRGKIEMTRAPAKVTNIQITSPEAGKTYYIGDKVMILWSKALIQNCAHVWLFVCWPDRTTCGGGYAVDNTGSYEWAINEAEEHDLVIRIRADDDVHEGYSGVFHVKKRILKPREGLVGPLKKK